MKKRGQFNFVWLFAILVGAAILFLAIYGALKTTDTQRFKTDTEIAKEITILTNPLQAGFSEGSFGSIAFNQETRIQNICFEKEAGFGKQDLSVATRSGIGAEWNQQGGATSVYNRYIFSSEKNTGEDYYVFSKPFEFPYKIADLIMITPDNYCFINFPDRIQEEITNMNIPNIQIDPSCDLKDQIRVCYYSGSDCDTTVYATKVVNKNGEEMTYTGNLMYAAIFSEKAIYDCNVKRLLYRTGKIAEELGEKTDLMNARGCGTNLKADLAFWEASTMNSNAEDLPQLAPQAENLQNKNDRELCNTW